MRGEGHLDLVVDIEPFRMVVHLLGLQRRAGHEGEGGLEVSELVGLLNCIAFTVQGFPALERLECGSSADLLAHAHSSPSCPSTKYIQVPSSEMAVRMPG